MPASAVSELAMRRETPDLRAQISRLRPCDPQPGGKIAGKRPDAFAKRSPIGLAT
jgi:hypothetical protein